MDSGEEVGLIHITRRACLRLAVLAATGLSLVPGLRASGSTPLDKWSRLGHVWREMSAHAKGQRGRVGLGKPAFDKLKTEMTAALDALPASPALRVVFEERWAHIDRTQYAMATCYKMVAGGPPPARSAVEEQVKELEQLTAEGRLTKEAAAKAAGVLAVQAEYLVRVRAAERAADGEQLWEAWGKLLDDYRANRIKPGEPASLAGKRLAEMTVSRLGWLAGPPKEDEGIGQPEEP